LPGGIASSRESLAETVENNVRKLIIDEHPINPRYYERISELLDALIKQRRQEAISYQEYLGRIVELTRQAKNPNTAKYPKVLDTRGKRALFDNLGNDESLALAVHEAVIANRHDGWRSNKIKTRKIQRAIKEALHGDEALTASILKLVENHNEY
jgi:type I restriction enzyme R subunit